MTISSENNKNTYNGNGVTDTFAYTFKILAEDEILVQKKVTATGVITTLVLTTDYTVTGEGTDAGGNVVLVDPATDAPTGSKIILTRNVELVQETDYTEYDTFPANSHEEALDRLTMIAQQQEEKVDRSLKFDATITSVDAEIVSTPTAGQILAINSAADGLEFIDVVDLDGIALPVATGILTQTVAGTTLEARTITGTSNEITVTNGNGVSANPTLSLPSSLTFTGKTITGGTYSGPAMQGVTYFSDASDTSKRVAFVLSGITTATTRNITFQDSAGTLALTANKLSDFAATTSAELAGVITNETGSGSLVFATSPTLVTPALGVPASGTLTNCTGLPISTGVSGLGSNVATFLATPSSANLLSAVTDEIGSGSIFAGSTWTSFTPTLSSSVGGDTLPVYTTNIGRYMQIGKLVIVVVKLSGDGGAEGNGAGFLQIAMPVAYGTNFQDERYPCGLFVNGATNSLLWTSDHSGQNQQFIYQTGVTTLAAFTPSLQNNTSRQLWVKFTYETD